MDAIILGIAELLRPVIALLVKGIIHGIILSVMGPIWFVQFLYREIFHKGLGEQDRLRVTRFHENSSHQAPKWKECRECVEFMGLLKSVGDVRLRATNEAMDAQKSEMSCFHKQDSHEEPSWSDCRECIEYIEQSRSTLSIAFSRKVAEGTAEAVMTPFHKQSSHREVSWINCRTCIEYIEQIEVGPLDRIIPPRT